MGGHSSVLGNAEGNLGNFVVGVKTALETNNMPVLSFHVLCLLVSFP